VAVGGHDTASALTSVSGLDNGSAFVSAGTTIVVGSETERPLVNDATFDYGFKNCRGTEGSNLLIRNNTGFWLMQQCKPLWELKSTLSFAILSKEARDTKGAPSIFDPEDSEFEHPRSMTESIRRFVARRGQTPPMSRADYTRSIYASLALQVRWCLDGLQIAIGRKVESLHLIGGGANDNFFCEQVTDCTGIALIAGPAEATIFGNVMVQLLASAEVSSLGQLREVMRQSTETRAYTPKYGASDEWGALYERFLGYKDRASTCTKI
jgi:rhamnulokinase